MQIELEKLRKRPLMIGTPAYGGLVSTPYHISAIDLTTRFAQLQIPIKHALIENESLITRGRNNLVNMFLHNKEFDHLLFIDADIRFDTDYVLALLALSDLDGPYQIICGNYPKKSINWEMISQAVQAGIPVKELNQFIENPVLNLVPTKDGQHQLNLANPIEVLDTGTGFMMIQRTVFEQMIEAFGEKLHYIPDYAMNHPDFDKNREKGVYAFFDVGVYSDQTSIQKEQSGRMRYLSEDYLFCRRWRELGGKIWVCPWMNLTHHGTFHYQGNLPATLQLQAQKSVIQQQKGGTVQINVPSKKQTQTSIIQPGIIQPPTGPVIPPVPQIPTK